MAVLIYKLVLSKNKYLQVLVGIMALGLAVRVLSIFQTNIIIGFDQARDLFDSLKIIAGDIRIVGPTAGNNANLHHGVAFLYFMIPPLVFGGGNPFYVSLWNSLFNLGSCLIIYLLTKSLFNDEKPALIATAISAFSYYFIQFSGWISNPTVTLLTVPLFFYGLWLYKQNNNKGLILAALSLGISIQFELFFLYLIPTGIIVFFLLKMKFPNPRTMLYALCAMLFALSTMVATEIKFKFSGVISLLSATGGTQTSIYILIKEFFSRFWLTFSQNLWPQKPQFGIYIGIILLGFIVYKSFNNKENLRLRLALRLLILYLLSPLLMLVVGFHKAPWFLIGIPPAIAIMTGYVLAKVKPPSLLILLVLLICITNLLAVKNSYGFGQPLLEPDQASILSSQLSTIDYTYQKAEGKPFAINTVTNPLYINAVWAYHYKWYGKKYGYLPTWLGGDQIPPYNTLAKAGGKEEIFFLIIDETPRIPVVHKMEAIKWAKEKGKLIEEKEFNGILVQAYKTIFSASRKVF